MAKDKKWIQKAVASVKRRGTEGKCTPITKPGCTGRARQLALTFKKMARKRKKSADGGYVDQYDLGGLITNLLPALNAVVPGVGTAASSLAGLIADQERGEPSQPLQQSTNPFGMRGGGAIPNKIGILREEGYPEDQAAAIAYSMQERGKLAKGGSMDQYLPDYKKGGIYIKPSKRGSFTAWCKKQGYGGVTDECISQGKNSRSAAIRKKATFAKNARSWNKEFGGQYQNGGHTNGVKKNLANFYKRLTDTDILPKEMTQEQFSELPLEEINKYRDAYMESIGALTPEEQAKKFPGAKTVSVTNFDIGIKEETPEQVRTFEDAFSDARSKGLKTFEFAGKKYSTDLGGAATPPSGRTEVIPGSERKERLSMKELAARKKGNRRMGGDFKQYDAPYHEHGGQYIDANGNPTRNPHQALAEIEGRENTLIDPSNKVPAYIFSEVLGTAEKAADIHRKMKGDDIISRKGKKLAFNNLKRENEVKRKAIETYQNGGQYPTGGPFSLIGQVMKPAFNKYIAKQFEENPNTESVLQDTILNTTVGMDRLSSGAFDQPATDPFAPTDKEVTLGTSPMSDVPVTQRLPSRRLPPRVSQGAYATEKLPTLYDQRKPVQSMGTTQQPLTTDNIPGGEDMTTTDEQGNKRINIGAILKGAAYAGRAADVLQPYERERLQLPDFSAGDRLVAGTGTGFQAAANQALGAANIARETARASSRNLSQFMGRQRAISGSLGRNLADVKMRESQYRDQLALQRAGREDVKATQIAGERIRQQVATTQNRAMRQDLIQNLMSDINNLGTEVQRQQVIKSAVKDMNKNARRQFMIDLMSTNLVNPNFQIVNPKEYMKSVDAGDWEKASEMIKFID